MLPPDVRTLLTDQDGVASRAQLLELGARPHDLARWARGRLLARVHPGVFVDHTGPLLPDQRRWAAVLRYAPAALWGPSALRAHGMRAPDSGPVHVAVAHGRDLAATAGVTMHRVRPLAERVAWHLSPPRLSVEEAVLATCSLAPTTDKAYAVVADACQERRTTPERIRLLLDDGRRQRHGAFLRAALTDVAEGALSVLERGYLLRVERAHGLPRGRRQVSATVGTRAAWRDVEYEGLGLVVELDGRIGHEWSRDRLRDTDRDLVAVGRGRATVRIGWGHVFGSPCRLAGHVAQALRVGGWDGRPRRCGPSCTLDVP